MKTIIENQTKLSKYLLQDEVNATLTENNISYENIIITDLNVNNATLVENVTPPEDWSGNKYTYENDTFVLNPNWIDPKDYEKNIPAH